MAKDLRLSIIIVSYNAGESLERCIRALALPADADNVEVIVVDNHSSDGTPEMLTRAFPDVQLIENEDNVGFSRAFNRGARRARAPLVLSMNSDCVIEAGALSILLDEMRVNARAGVLGPRLMHTDGKEANSAFKFPTLLRPLLDTRTVRSLAGARFSLNYPPSDPRMREGGRVDWLSGACLLFRKDALKELGYLNERYFMYFEDVDICRRMWRSGWEVLYITGARVCHAGGASSVGMEHQLALEKQRSRLIYFSEQESFASYSLMRLWTAVAAVGRGLWQLATFRWDRLRIEKQIFAAAMRGARRQDQLHG